jgi:hypothetical protein
LAQISPNATVVATKAVPKKRPTVWPADQSGALVVLPAGDSFRTMEDAESKCCAPYLQRKGGSKARETALSKKFVLLSQSRHWTVAQGTKTGKSIPELKQYKVGVVQV